MKQTQPPTSTEPCAPWEAAVDCSTVRGLEASNVSDGLEQSQREGWEWLHCILRSCFHTMWGPLYMKSFIDKLNSTGNLSRLKPLFQRNPITYLFNSFFITWFKMSRLSMSSFHWSVSHILSIQIFERLVWATCEQELYCNTPGGSEGAARMVSPEKHQKSA